MSVKTKMKSLFLELMALVALVAIAVGFIKWKTDWLDSDPEKKFKEGTEAFYIAKLAEELNGKTEVRIKGGRIDILTDEYAIEVERASKWKNAIGQSLWYALNKTTKSKPMKPKIILLMRSDEEDYQYVNMLESVLLENGLEIKVDLEYME